MVDASVIPTTISGNTYTTQIMIAEKAADIIREKDTVAAIKEYFKYLLAIKNKRFEDDEDVDPIFHHIKQQYEQQQQEDQLKKEQEAKKAQTVRVGHKPPVQPPVKPVKKVNGKNNKKKQ